MRCSNDILKTPGRSVFVARRGGLLALTYGDEQVRYPLLVLPPGITVLGTATVDVTRRTVGNHTAEEERVEPRERAPVIDECG